MGPVAEGLVQGGPAAAEGDPVAHLVRSSVGADHRDPTPDPDRTGAAGGGIFDQAERRGEIRLDQLSGCQVPGHETAGGAILDLLEKVLPRHRLFRLVHEIPDASVGIAEAGQGAELGGIEEVVVGPFEDLGLLFEGEPGSGFGSVEVDAGVGAVAEGFAGTCSAAAEGVGLSGGKGGALLPSDGFSRPVRADGHRFEGKGSGHQIGAVLLDFDPAGRVSFSFHGLLAIGGWSGLVGLVSGQVEEEDLALPGGGGSGQRHLDFSRDGGPVPFGEGRAVGRAGAGDDLHPEPSARPGLMGHRDSLLEDGGKEPGVLMEGEGAVPTLRGGDETEPVFLVPGREVLLLVPRGKSRGPGQDPDLKEMDRLPGGRVGFAVAHPGAGGHPLDIAGAEDRALPHAVGMGEGSRNDIADDLHVAMAVGAEAAAGLDPVLVDDPEGAELDMVRVVIVGEGEGVPAVEPPMVGVAPLGTFAKNDHGSSV